MVRQDEAAALAQTLNEVLHGFRPARFDPSFEKVRESGEELLQRFLILFREYGESSELEIGLSNAEAITLRLAAELCIEHIHGSEFSTRIGASTEEMKRYIQLLGRQITP